jgi:hypothetical protein
MHTINEVFLELDMRIDVLRNLWNQIDASQLTRPLKGISDIERNIFKFKEEAGERIDISLQELNQLLDRGISIIPPGMFSGDPHDENILTLEDLQKDAEKEREDAYKSIKAEITFYIKKLTLLKEKQTVSENQPTSNNTTITLGDNFNFPILKTTNPDTIPILSKDQLALLFHYLRENKIILPYDDKSISKLVMNLTGYSDETLRQNSYRKIHDLKKEIPHNNRNSEKSNLLILSEALKKVLKEIDKEIKSTSPVK